MKVCVVGLGYVGLPLAVALAKKQQVFGFDINAHKIASLKRHVDLNHEVEDAALKGVTIDYSHDAAIITKADVVIVAVPTPIHDDHTPDLRLLKDASALVGANLRKGMTVCYESTVYPGVTEEVCAPILEEKSGLRCGPDFKIGYSPERINPGDREHTVEKIVKVVAGCDMETTELLAGLYGSVIVAGIHKAPSIKTAEAAKVIENIQRDLNIALMNELSLIFHRMGIDTQAVIKAASTKWNFHPYTPGLVGGHCIGVDPYYLTYKARELGYLPQVILAGRDTNEFMPTHVANVTKAFLAESGRALRGATVLILGLTFKEDVADARNSKVGRVIWHLHEAGCRVLGCDPHLNAETVSKEFGVDSAPIQKLPAADAIILASPHKEFRALSLAQLRKLSPILVDVKGVFEPARAREEGLTYFRL